MAGPPAGATDLIPSLILATALAVSGPSCTPASIDYSNVMPFQPTPEQWQQIAVGLKSPSVVGLRHALAAYESGKADRETTAALRPFDRRALQGPFALLSENSGIFGGTNLEIEFTGRCAAVYLAWIYPYANGTWVVRKFIQTTCTKTQLQWINVRYREVLDFTENFKQ